MEQPYRLTKIFLCKSCAAACRERGLFRIPSFGKNESVFSFKAGKAALTNK